MQGARAAALQALLHVDVNAGYSNLVLDHTLSENSLDFRDRALVTAIFYGVLERRITLDYVIGHFSSIPLRKISPMVLEILRIGVYQILYLQKIPPSAAVSESVNLAKASGAKYASGFVNAVLRSLLRSGGRVPPLEQDVGSLERLSVEYSVPVWLISLWERSYGEKTMRALLKSVMEKADLFARVNNTRISEEKLIEGLQEEGVAAERIAWPDHAIRLTGVSEIAESGCYRRGLFHIQDLSSQILCAAIDPQPGETMIDVCAAPGGKTFTMAERMENRGKILAFDQYPQKVELIRNGAERLGLSCIYPGLRDATGQENRMEPADRVLCDVPCSGLGIIRRKPEIRYKLQSSIDSLPDLQYLILCKSSEMVRSGGVLFYSTCTLNQAENGAVANRFLEEHPDFLPRRISLSQNYVHAVQEPDNQMTLMPQIHGTDGFFFSAFQKN